MPTIRTTPSRSLLTFIVMAAFQAGEWSVNGPMQRLRAPLVFIEPMVATHVVELPRGPEWSYEVKLDGYRVLALKSGEDVRLLSRRNKDLTRDFPSVVAAVRSVRATTVMLD